MLGIEPEWEVNKIIFDFSDKDKFALS